MNATDAERITNDYIVRCLSSDYLFETQEPSSEGGDGSCKEDSSRNFLVRHALQFYWTLTRALGLGFIHGSKTEDVKSENIIEEQTVLGKEDVLYVKDFIPWSHTETFDGERNRILIDVTMTFLFGQTTGIQRVVREVTKFAAYKGLAIPVVLGEACIFEADLNTGALEHFEIVDGDLLFLLDSTWFISSANVHPAIKAIKDRDGYVVACIYDLLPLQYPLLCGKEHSSSFKTSFHQIAPAVDGFVTISANVADTVRSYLAAHFLPIETAKPIHWWHLGADLPQDHALGLIADPVLRSLEHKAFFVCVGTVEPRKGHLVALEAFEALWAMDVNVTLVIMGGRGWTMDAFEHRLQTHPERNRRLFRFQSVTDADLAFAYASAQALVMPTIAEGFGLPTIEAAILGTPVIASDISIMREIGGESFYYFGLLNPASLAATISDFLKIEPSQRRVLSNILTWTQASENVMRLASNMMAKSRVPPSITADVDYPL